MKKQLAKEHRDNKDIVFDLLQTKKVKTFTVTFDGGGDSGQIEDFTLDDELLEMEVKGASVTAGEEWVDNKWVKNLAKNPTLRAVVEELCYEALESVCGGWEIDNGSYGEFVFDVSKRTIRLDFNERVTEVNSSVYDF